MVPPVVANQHCFARLPASRPMALGNHRHSELGKTAVRAVKKITCRSIGCARRVSTRAGDRLYTAVFATSHYLELCCLSHPQDNLDAADNWSIRRSSDEQQRLAFVHVFLTRPKLVFLDEVRNSLEARRSRLCIIRRCTSCGRERSSASYIAKWCPLPSTAREIRGTRKSASAS